MFIPSRAHAALLTAAQQPAAKSVAVSPGKEKQQAGDNLQPAEPHQKREHAKGGAREAGVASTGADRAETMGLRTAGRVAEQTLIRLPDGGGLLLSSTRYLTASGEPIHRVGVEPAVVVPEPTVELGRAVADPDLDPVLDRALEHLAAMPTV